jgi:hypothetical protein
MLGIIKLGLTIGCVGLALCGVEAQEPKGQILWGKLRAGMSKAEVKAAQPSKVEKISDQCSVNLSFDFEGQSLRRVGMDPTASSSDECRNIALKSLAAKYGDNPIQQEELIRGNCGGYNKIAQLCRAMGGENIVTHTYFTWSTGGTKIQAEITDTDSRWTIVYAVDPQASVETIKKF